MRRRTNEAESIQQLRASPLDCRPRQQLLAERFLQIQNSAPLTGFCLQALPRQNQIIGRLACAKSSQLNLNPAVGRLLLLEKLDESNTCAHDDLHLMGESAARPQVCRFRPLALLLAPPGQAVRGALAPSHRPASSAPSPRPTAGFRLTRLRSDFWQFWGLSPCFCPSYVPCRRICPRPRIRVSL